MPAIPEPLDLSDLGGPVPAELEEEKMGGDEP